MADRRSTRPRKKLKDEQYRFIDECMAEDDELTAAKMLSLLLEKFPTLNVSVSTVKRARMELGWTAKKTRYGALISESNQEKRVEWCKERIETGDMDFDDVLFTDKCTVQLSLNITRNNQHHNIILSKQISTKYNNGPYS